MDVNNTTNIGKVKLIMLKGEAGNSIASIEKTSTTDTHEIYTITFTDGTTQQIAIAKGNGIVSIEKTATVGLVDTYTITFTDDSTTTFDIINGQSYTVPTDGVLYYDGSTLPEGFVEVPAPSGSGQYAEIDDTTPSVSKTYSSQKIESLLSYSATEHIVGTWIDGKDIYEVSYERTTAMSSGDTVISDLMDNCEKVIELRIYLHQIYNGTEVWTVLPIDDTNGVAYSFGDDIRINLSSTYASNRANAGCIVVVKYTKSSL